ncbi:hypothetical protein NJ7G_1571 [Natrinema sp. J7-2]|nr:hypothetical protein NJ7G_1571 [Natrinema sp. J7-2]
MSARVRTDHSDISRRFPSSIEIFVSLAKRRPLGRADGASTGQRPSPTGGRATGVTGTRGSGSRGSRPQSPT